MFTWQLTLLLRHKFQYFCCFISEKHVPHENSIFEAQWSLIRSIIYDNEILFCQVFNHVTRSIPSHFYMKPIYYLGESSELSISMSLYLHYLRMCSIFNRMNPFSGLNGSNSPKKNTCIFLFSTQQIIIQVAYKVQFHYRKILQYERVCFAEFSTIFPSIYFANRNSVYICVYCAKEPLNKINKHNKIAAICSIEGILVYGNRAKMRMCP